VVNLYPDNPRLPRIDGQRITEVIDGNLRSPKRDKTYAEIGLEAFASHPSQVGQDLAQPAYSCGRTQEKVLLQEECFFL